MKIVILGTSCMVPTKLRNVQSIYLEHLGEGLLIDCGEGTQRQMNIAGLNRNKVKKILISHWHGDHIGGLIGLFQTLSNNETEDKIQVYGPTNTKKFLKYILALCGLGDSLKIQVQELKPSKKTTFFFENDKYKLGYISLKHSMPCLGFCFIEKDKRKIMLNKAEKLKIPKGPLLGKLQKNKSIKFKGKTIKPNDVSFVKKGKKISFICDTSFTKTCLELSKDSDLLICEAAYADKLKDKAEKNLHLTAKQAAYIANKSNVNKLVLTHFSQRYKTVDELLQEAKTYFSNSECAYDLMKIKL